MKMQFNECENCGAGNGRAGILINSLCLNCHYTKTNKSLTIHTILIRTSTELKKTEKLLKQ